MLVEGEERRVMLLEGGNALEGGGATQAYIKHQSRREKGLPGALI